MHTVFGFIKHDGMLGAEHIISHFADVIQKGRWSFELHSVKRTILLM